MRCLVLGAGVVGEAVAWDLTHVAPTADVTLTDSDATRLAALGARLPVQTATLDVMDAGGRAALDTLVETHDVVVGALPSVLGFTVLDGLCCLGAAVCDVSFMPERAGMLDEVARAAGARVVYDCGVAPGLSHVLVGSGVAALSRVARVRIDVGGLPERPRPPFFYKAPFAPSDVIEEYTRPVRLVRDGVVTTAEPLSEVERLHVDDVGTLDSFLTDGLRSLIETTRATMMEERTLRHQGHLPLVRVLRDVGLFDETPRLVDGVAVSPRALTSAVLFPHWRYDDDERDVTVLRVEVAGRDASGAPRRAAWRLVDRPDAAVTGSLSSMARTTGFPAAIVARWLADGTVATAGAHAPELLGLHGHAPALLSELRRRGIHVESAET